MTNPTPERSDESLRRAVEQLDKDLGAQQGGAVLAGPLYAWHVVANGYCGRCREPWPCLIVREYRQGVHDGIAAYRESREAGDASTDGA